MDENEKINQNKLICNICNSPDKYFLCHSCFKHYNKIYKDKKNNFLNSEKAISEKIEHLLKCNEEKAKKLNKKILCDRYFNFFFCLSLNLVDEVVPGLLRFNNLVEELGIN